MTLSVSIDLVSSSARVTSVKFQTLPGIALLTLSVGIDLVSSSARVTSVKFQKHDSVSDGHPDPKIGPQVYLGPIKIVFSSGKHL